MASSVCPLCLSEIGKATSFKCPGCGSKYHKDCAADSGECIVVGCSAAAADKKRSAAVSNKAISASASTRTKPPGKTVNRSALVIAVIVSLLLGVGAPIRVFGYPGIGGDSITFTSGYVAGWARDQGANEDAAVLKIDITIAGGSSGSAVLDTLGRVVGVVMMGGVSTDGSVDILDCRQLVDTNGDGKIDDSDSCLPLGGFLNGAVALAPLRAFLRAENVLP